VRRHGGGAVRRCRSRNLLERFDLSPCFTVTDGGACWILNCRHCTAGWLPKKNHRCVDNLIEHAHTHGVMLRRRPRVAKTIERRLVIRIGGHIVKSIRQNISVARADLERGGNVTIDCTYGPTPVASVPPATPVLATPQPTKSQLWSAAVQAWLLEQRGGDD
jgi:hypothetical protein